MSVFNERPGSMRPGRGSQVPFDIRMQAGPVDSGPRTRTGRKLAALDNGTVALAISGMTFYWMMPMMMGRRRKRRRAPDNPPA